MSHHLSHQATLFVGRAEELSEIGNLLSNPACQLLTLVGPGGIGKTRLALEAIRPLTFADGTYVVPLQAVLSTEHLVSAIASAIGLQFIASDQPRQQMLNVLRKKHLLLLLDNFEQLLESADLVSEMIAHAPGLQVIVTSRERLNLSSETVFSVGGMPVPDLEASLNLLDYGAIALFVQCVRRAHPHFVLAETDFPHLIRICRVADGMPLALLLAAAWVGILSMSEIAAEMERSLEFLDIKMRDLPERHHSIRATFDWSWNLLPDFEREVFQKLSVFRDGFTREGAKAVAGASLKILMELVNKSLVQVKGDGRYDLHELLRQYSEEKLTESPEAYQQARDVHCQWYAAFCVKVDKQFPGPQEYRVLEFVYPELQNISVARKWAVEHQHRDVIWSLLFPIKNDFALQNRLHEARTELEQIIEKLKSNSSENNEDNLLFTLYALLADIYCQLGLLQDADRLAENSLTLFHDENEVHVRREIVQALLSVTNLKGMFNDPVVAQSLLQRVLAMSRVNSYPLERSIALCFYMNNLLNEQNDKSTPNFEQIQAELLETVTGAKSQYVLYIYQRFSAAIAFDRGNYLEAKKHLLETHDKSPNISIRSGATNDLAECFLQLGDYEEALRYCYVTLQMLREVRARFNLAYALLIRAKLFAVTGEKIRAVQLTSSIFHRKDRHHTLMIDRARLFLSDLEKELASEDFAQAMEWGKIHDLEQVADELLAERDQTTQPSKPLTNPQPLLDPLTDRELEILRLVADGLSNRQIAAKVFLALGSVKWYVSDICSKLGVANRTHAVTRARELNLLK